MVLRLLAGSGIVSLPALVLAVLVVAAIVVLAPRAARTIAAKVRAAKPSPQPVVDEGGVQPEGSVVVDSNGTPCGGDPENPGGGPTGGMG